MAARVGDRRTLRCLRRLPPRLFPAFLPGRPHHGLGVARGHGGRPRAPCAPSQARALAAPRWSQRRRPRYRCGRTARGARRIRARRASARRRHLRHRRARDSGAWPRACPLPLRRALPRSGRARPIQGQRRIACPHVGPGRGARRPEHPLEPALTGVGLEERQSGPIAQRLEHHADAGGWIVQT